MIYIVYMMLYRQTFDVDEDDVDRHGARAYVTAEECL